MRPSTVLTSAAVTASLVNASTWSSADSASRMLPSADRATSASARVVDLDLLARRDRLAAARGSTLNGSVFSSNTCDRDWIVAGTACSSVVAIMNFTYGGGSSIDFSSASNALFERRCTSSMMKILNRSRIGAMRERLDDDLADGVDAGVGGAVDLEHVDVAALGDLDARVALAARLGRRALHAVERARQDPRRRRLADAARARKDERLREPAGGDRVLQRLDDAALADDVFEALRAPFAGEGEMGTWKSGEAEARSCDRRAPDRGPEGLRHSTGST